MVIPQAQTGSDPEVVYASPVHGNTKSAKTGHWVTWALKKIRVENSHETRPPNCVGRVGQVPDEFWGVKIAMY